MANEFLWQTGADCGGIDNTHSDYVIGDNDLSDARNYQPDFTGQGWLIKREGVTKEDSNARSATSYSIFDGRNGNYYHNGTVIYNFAGTSLSTGNAAAIDTWTSFLALDIFANGTDIKKTADGSTFAALSGVPAGTKYIASHNNALWAAGHDHGKLRWSSFGTAETWTATYEKVLSQDENDDITGMKPWTNALGVWCSQSFYMVQGWSNIDVQISYSKKGKGVGHVGGPNGIVITPYGPFWWALNGLAWLKPDYTLDYPMKRKLAKTLNGLNRARDVVVHGVWDSVQGRVMYWLSNGAAQTTHNLRMDYYPQTDSFYLHSGAGVNMACSGAVTVSGVDDVYVSGYTSGVYLYKQSGATDDSVAIASYLETKREGNPLVKRWGNNIYLSTDLTAQADITYGAYINNESAIATTNSYTCSSIATGQVDTAIKLDQKNRRIKHRISDSATSRTRIIQLTHSGQQDKAGLL